jgi:hypothetical protein
MNDSMIEDMAEFLATSLQLENNKVLNVLHRYWVDKIASVWQVDDLLEAALNLGRPITREDAIEVLKDAYDDHDPELGISWNFLVASLQEYHLDWKHLPEGRYGEVQGVFKVWREGDVPSNQFGSFPDELLGNLPKALAFAKSLADQAPEIPVLIGCARRYSDKVERWLTVTRVELHPMTQELDDALVPSGNQ